DSAYDETVSGAVLRASRTESDFALVEITDTSFFAANPDVIWAGWDRTDTPPSYTVGIHHPAGDIQKVCRDDNSPNPIDDGEEYWQITNAGNGWELGVTEGGSSGSPLFDPNGRIIGQLWRGQAACSGTNDNDLYDDYGRFGISWDTGTTASSRLKDWLDPINTGVTELDQYPPLTVYAFDAGITINNTSANHCGGVADIELQLSNNGSTTLTSATITYNIDSESAQTINWTGSLLQGESEIVASENYTGLSDGSHTFNASVSNPNGNADENTFNNDKSRNFEVPLTIDSISIELELTTDDYGDETGWELRDTSGAVLSSNSSTYANNTTTTETIDLPVNDACYTFVLTDSYGDGICCDYGNGSYTLRDSSGNEITSGGSFYSEDASIFYALSNLNITDEDLSSTLIYPNPSSGVFTVKTVQPDLNFEVYNILGQNILKGSFTNTTNHINLNTQAPGMYILKVYDGDAILNVKLVKQ
ncbi:MAG: T9SS type A sorting domain-containing protein, partial [Flavobacteriaceae bacterium]|nr:T9SS type A sorting domain-containing protein [Flavobacteriaceae bacterium]